MDLNRGLHLGVGAYAFLVNWSVLGLILGLDQGLGPDVGLANLMIF